MSDDLVIRIAKTDDMDEIMPLAMMSHAENGLGQYDIGKVATELWSSLNLDHGMVGVIGRPGGPIEGGVLLRIGSLWYSSESVLEERVVFIHPDYRSAKGGRAKRLLQFSKESANDLGIPLLISVLSNTRTAAKMRLYARQLGAPAGGFFLYGARTGSE